MDKGSRRALKWLIKSAKPVLWQIFLLAFLGVLISYISVRFALASRDLLDSATGGTGKSFADCVRSIVLLLAADISVQSIYNILSVRLEVLYRNRLRRGAFADVMVSDLSALNEYHSGELINRLTKDIRVLSANIIDLIPSVVILVSGVAMSFWALFKLDSTLAVLCIALGPVILVSSFFYGRRVKSLHKDCLKSDGKILSFMQEVIQNLLIIKAFRKEKQFDSGISDLQSDNYRLNMKVGYASLIVNVLYFVALTAAYYFAVAWCAYRIHLGVMTVGSFAAIIQLVGSVQTPFKEISGSLTKFFATCASAERIMDMEKLPRDKEDTLHMEDVTGIEFKGVDFSYESEKVFENASFRINKGDIVAVTGGSGIGKSTLFKLLLGIYTPQKGSAYIYNKEEKVSAGANTRSAFCYVPQGNMIISGTIGQNITFFDSSPDMARARDAAERACILDYIDTLPEGMDTAIGENGLGLSEGQAQRLAIARAIYADMPVILLDEATSALDDKTESRILDNIKGMQDKTCMIITHRPAALDIANKRLHIEDRQIKVDEKIV